MSDKITYLVETLFKAKDEASKSLHDIGHSAHEAHEHVSDLKSVLKEVGEAFLLFEAAEKGKEIFVGLNSELQQTKIMMTSVLGANFKKPWEQAKEAAGEFYEEFEGFAEKFPTSVNEMGQNMQVLAGAVSQAGGGMEDLKKITEGSVVASKALKVEANQLFMMLEGHVSKRSAGGMALLNSVGMTPEQWQKQSAGARMKLMERALGSDVMKSAGAEFADSFSGQATIIKDRVEMMLAKVGMPLFKAISTELKSWNEWLDKNKEKVEKIGEMVGHELVAGFEAIKSVTSFIADHSDVLIKVAEAWAAVKLGGMMGEIKGGGEVGKVLGKMLGGAGAGYALGGFGGGLLGGGLAMGGKGGAIAGAAGFGYMIGEQVYKAIDKPLEKIFSPIAYKEERLIESIEMLDGSMREANEHARTLKGAAGTVAAANLSGVSDLASDQLRTLLGVSKIKGYGDEYSRRNLQKASLEGHGFDQDEINAALDPAKRGQMIGRLQRHVIQDQSRYGAGAALTDAGIKFALDHMNSDQKAELDVAKATQEIMREQLILMGTGKAAMSAEQIAASLVAAQEIARINGIADQAKVNQTVNVHIEQVSAKDPDRWLADLDDYASRKVRSRTRARGAPARGF